MKKKTSIFTVILIIILVIIIAVKTVDSNSQIISYSTDNKSSLTKDIVSYTNIISYTQQLPLSYYLQNDLKQSGEDVTFTLNLGTISTNPISKFNYRISSKLSGEFTFSKETITSANFKSDKFILRIGAAGEGNGFGLVPGNLEHSPIGLLNGVTIFRVKDDDNLFNWIENEGFSNRYFYTNGYYENDDCAKNGEIQHCGSSFLTFSRRDNYGYDFVNSVCMVNESKYLEICDNFVKNLKLEVFEL